MITMVKLDSFDTFDMQWVFWVCYCIVCYTRPFRPAFHHRKGNKPSMAFSVAPSSSLGITLNLFTFLIFSEDRSDELDKSADAPLKPNISVSIIASDDIMITSHAFNVAAREIRQASVIGGTVRYFCHSNSREKSKEQSVIFTFDSTLRVMIG